LEALMKKQRRIIFEGAVSADGFIARRDGSVDWLERPRPKGNYGMGEFMSGIDTILWGHKTYDKGIELGMDKNPWGFEKLKNYVFSRKPQGDLMKGFVWVTESIGSFAQKLRMQPGKDIWMMGGGEIAGAFLDEGEMDEFRLTVIPVFIGEGIPLLGPRRRLVPLRLCGIKKFADGVVRATYEVQREKAKTKKN
jgi:dihydrofolate reductase